VPQCALGRTTSKDLRSDLEAFAAVRRSLLHGCYMVGVLSGQQRLILN
jgi:hypothetical protein